MYGYYTQRHKVFISFYHKDDQAYKEYIDKYLSGNIINKSVVDGEYSTDNSDESKHKEPKTCRLGNIRRASPEH